MRTLLSFLFFFLYSLATFGQTGPGGYGNTTDISSGLVLWLKADAGVTSGGDGTDVVSWADQSASGLTAIPGGTAGAAPIYDADGGVNFNNQPVLFFDDPQDNWMYIEGDAGELAALEGQTEMSIFFVFNSDSRTGNKNIISKRDGNNSSQQFTFYQNNNILSRYVQNTETGSSITVGTTYINSATYDNGVLAQWLNQAVGNSGSGASPLPSNNSDFNIGTFDNSGGASFDNRTFEGEIAEIIIYNAFLNEAEKIAVENYLSAKYGATLSTDDRWDEAKYSAHFGSDYNNEIAGIGRTATGISANQATSAILTITAGAGLDNGEWLFWGHDGGDITGYAEYETVTNRLQREWAIDSTGDMGMVTVSIAATDLPSTGLAAPSFNLIIDDDGDFSFGVVSTLPMTLNGGNYEVTANLTEGQVLTVSYDAPAPGGVTETLAFWFEAGSGVSSAVDGDPVTSWNDLSSLSVNATGGTSPSYNSSQGINFRPVVEFDRSSSEFLTFDISGLANTNYTVLSVVERASATADQYFIGSDNASSDFILGYLSNAQAYGGNRTGTGSSFTIASVNDFDDPVQGPALVTLDYNSTTPALTLDEYRAGINATSTSAVSIDYDGSGTGNIGNGQTSDYFDGKIAEIIAFPTNLSAAEYNAIVSNLAIKYGVSLNTDYVDEAATPIWDFSAGDTDGYIQDVTAIGFDESFNLDQKISKSSTDSIVLATSADFTSLNSDVSRPSLSDGQFVFIANDDSLYNLDQTFNGVNNSRLHRIWRVDETGAPGAVVIAIPTSIATLNFMLVSTDDDFTSQPVEQVALVESGGYYYATYDFDDNDYFTFGFDDTEIWYSYKTGVWSDPNNWTLDGAVSALLVNPDNKTPLPGDSVVIKSGKTITVDVQDISVESMEINGILDLATTGGHDFNYMFGFGKLQMAGFGGADNYPDGVDTLFYDVDEGGTVEINGGDITLDQNRSFRNLVINMGSASNVATMLGNTINITKDLTVTRGDLQFNDNSSTSSVNMVVSGDILIESEGSMLVGTGNARHELDLFGDFTNQGLVEFTNRMSANYGSEATDGIVDLNFVSAEQDQALTLQNTVRLYRIEIDKGVDDAYTVDITADDPTYWNLLGFAAQNHGADNQLVSSLDENINALGLYFGTVKIGTNVDIPVLNTGGNYNVSEGAQIWVDGGSIAKSGGTAIVPYGTMRITSGTIDADINSGITTRGNATLIIEGGTVTVRQFRTSVFGAANQGGLVQTGGVFNVTGSGGTNTDYCTFNLTYEGNVFNMSGGTLNVSGPNSKGGIFIGSNPENVSTTGGTVNFVLDNSNDFVIASRASFYNLTMEKTTGSGSGAFVIDALTTGSGGSADRTIQGDSLNMTIINDLSINDSGNGTLFDANGFDLSITGTLTVASGATMTMNNNTLTFEGEGTSFIDIGTTGPLVLDSLVIDKDLDTDLVRITNGPDRAMTIASYFNHTSGRFDYQADTVVLSGELVVSDTIGLDTSTGELLLDGGSLQTIISTNGFIYDLVLDNAGDSLSGNLVVDSLVLDGGVFDIGTNELRINSDLSTNGTFGSGQKIETAGNASDGGLNIFISSNDIYEYPLGVMGKYTPVSADITLTNANTGYLEIRPVDQGLATVNLDGTDSLSYYWRVTHSDFGSFDLPNVNSYTFTYDNGDVSGGSADTDFVAGKVLDVNPFTRSYEGAAGVQVSATTILFDGLPEDDNGAGSPGGGFEIENANYTAAELSKFTGDIEIYYSRVTSGSWYDTDWRDGSNWSLTAHDGAAAGDFPQAGDIAIIGSAAHSGGNSPSHSMNIRDGETVEVAEIQYDISGNIQTRVVVWDEATLTFGKITVSGDGTATFMQRIDPLDVPTITGDFGEFYASSDALYDIYMKSDGTYNFAPPTSTFPNLILESGNDPDRIMILEEDITTLFNFSTFIGANLRTSSDPDKGDITVGGNLNIRGDFVFDDDADRTVTVLGNVNLTQTTSSTQSISVSNAVPSSRRHRLIVEGNISQTQGTASIDLYGGDIGSNDHDPTYNHVILELQGSTSSTYTYTAGTLPEFYQIIVNKGTDTTSTFTFNDDFGLPAAVDISDEPIDFVKGLTILDDASVDIALADGSELIIPSGAGLEVTQGTVTTANDASINLDGLLRINGGTATLNQTDIIYSNTGEALIEVSSGTLTVGNQIRRPITTSSGILKYRQSGGTVLVGADGESENQRAMFEVLNPGSEFTLSGGDFTIRRGVTGDDNPSLELDPATFDLTGSTITLGDASTPSVGGSNFFNIKSAIPLNNLTIDDDADFPVARAFSLAMTVDGLLEILANGDFDANGFQITLNGDLDNEGTFTNDDDLTLFSSAGSQEIRGAGSFTFFDVTKDNTGTLSLNTNSSIAVNNDLRVDDGILALGIDTLELKGDAYILSEVTNTVGGGFLSFNSDTNNQNLYGRANNTITLGKIQIDNPLGVDITDGFGYNFDITEELALLEGVFNVGGSLVTIKEGGFITGDLGGDQFSDFSINNMVQTNSSFVDNGLKIEFGEVFMSPDTTIIFPIGEQKFTPVIITLDQGTDDGKLRVRPANERHPTINDDLGTPGENEADSVLQYYWIVVAEDISAATGLATFYYDHDDVALDGDTAKYQSARLLEGNILWDKAYDLEDFEGLPDQKFNIDLVGYASAEITGDYTAGIGDFIPDAVPQYVSNASSLSANYNADVWIDENDDPVTINPSIGPIGGSVTISSGDTITINVNNVRLYETIIEEGGVLIVDPANFGHRLGNVRGTGTIQLNGTGELPAGEYSEFFDCTGGAVDYSGTGDYNVLGAISQIRKVSFTGTGQRIMPNNILEVCDTLYVNGPTLGPSLSLNTGQVISVGDVSTPNDLFWIENGAVTLSNSTTLDVNGSVDFEGGTFTGGSGTTIYIYENLSRTATTLDWNNTTVRFDGAAAQTITGNFQGTRAFDNIRINNSSSTGITLDGDIDIDGLLTFQDGHFYTSADDSLRLTNSGTKTGASANSHVKGPMIKNSVAASSSYTFPVGKGSRYAPVTIVDVGTGSDNWKAEYFTTNLNGTSAFDPADVGSGRGALSAISNDMWRVQSFGSNSAIVRVNYGSWHDSSDPSSLRLAWWDALGTNTSPAGPRWENQGGIVAVTSASTGTVTSESSIGFSTQDFSLGAVSEDALPVEMIYFRGFDDQGKVELDWATATEIDNDYFEVQRSQDGRDWEVIGVVGGAGTTVEEQVYDFTDLKPYVGNSYYRLRQIDFDGQFAFTDIILVNVRLEPVSFNVYPNPIDEVFTVDIRGINGNEEAPYSIISLQGAFVGQGVLKADEAGRINEQLSLNYGQPSGIYILKVGTSQRVFRFNLIKR